MEASAGTDACTNKYVGGGDLSAPSRPHRCLGLRSSYLRSEQPILRQPCVWLRPRVSPLLSPLGAGR